MLDDGFKRLDQLAQSRSLEGLEASVWAGIEASALQSRTSKAVAAWQSAVLAVALVSSIGMGAHTATQLPNGTLGVFSPHGSLSPATLLGGH
jgi:hypothetical protein